MQAVPISPTLRPKSVDVSTDYRIEIIFLYAECGYNAEETARRFNTIHAGTRFVTGYFVRRLISRFKTRGSVCDAKKTGRPRCKTDQFSAHSVIEVAESSANMSINRIAQQCDTTRYAVKRIMRENKLRRFRELRVQELRSEDPQKRHRFCSWFMEFRDIFSVLFTDEAVFYLHGKVEKSWFWARTNPRRYRPMRVQSSPKVMVWAGILGAKIIGPYFLSGNINGELNFPLICSSLFSLALQTSVGK